MGATYFMLAGQHLLVTAYWGSVRPEVSSALRESRASDPQLASARAHLIDLSHLEGTETTAQAEAERYRTLATSYGAVFGPLPTVIIASSDHVFGLARIFAIAASVHSPPLPVRIVRSLSEAQATLGIDLAEAQAELAKRYLATSA
jgi:hypothetical protein